MRSPRTVLSTLAAAFLALSSMACSPLDGATAGAEPGAQAVTLKGGAPAGTASTSASPGLSLSAPSVTAGQSFQATVTLSDVANATSGGVTVYVSFPMGDLAAPTRVLVPNGSRSATFTVYTNPYLAAATAATLTAITQNPNPFSISSATVQVAPASPPPAGAQPSVAAVILSSPVVVSGASVQATVALSGPAPAEGLAVRVALSYDAAHQNFSYPDVVVVPAGSSSASFAIQGHLAIAGATSTADFVVANVFGTGYAGTAITLNAP